MLKLKKGLNIRAVFAYTYLSDKWSRFAVDLRGMQILFRPKFCANCGEKVVRDEWHIWTSGRFCEICETEFQGREIAWRAACIGAVLVFDAISFVFVSPTRSVGTKLVAAGENSTTAKTLLGRAEPVKLPANQANEQATGRSTPQATPSPEQRPEVAESEPAYMCGAETKKGTPCTRRVKGNVRCWQHRGMPAMVSSDKLRID